MSVGVFRYSRSNAEIRGLVSRLLSRPELEALASAASLRDALGLLERTAYAEIAARALRAGAEAVPAERGLDLSMVEAYRRVAKLLAGPRAALIEEMARRLELDNLKTILRGLERGESPTTMRELLIPLGNLSRLPVEDLLRAENVSAVADALSGTDYGRVLANVMPRFMRERSLFAVEVALDLDYYRRLWSRVEALRGNDREVALRMMGIRYDLLNVDWVMRFRLVYHLEPEEIFNYTLPYGYRLGSEEIRRAASADDLAALAVALPEPYRGLLAPIGRARDIAGGAAGAVEQAAIALHRYQVATARAALTGYPFQIGVPIAYLWLKEAEVHDLKAILEGLRYGKRPDQTTAVLWGIG